MDATTSSTGDASTSQHGVTASTEQDGASTGAGGSSGPAAGSDLTPITPRQPKRSRPARRWIAVLVSVGIVVAVGFLVVNLLGDSALFFYNADEAVERRDELGSQRFTMQGTPLDEPVDAFWDDRPVLAFSIGFNDAVVDVVHTGDPPELFQQGVPVVLEGAWREGTRPAGAESGDGWHFASDRMLVKHDNDYRDRDGYEERITQADEGGTQ